MDSLNFNEGYKELAINGDESRVIRIDLTDYGMIERLNESYKKIDEFQKNCEDININADGTPADKLNTSAEMLTKFRTLIEEQIDYILDSKVSKIVFGNKNPLSTVNGVPLYQGFLNALAPYIKEVMQREQKESKKKIEKYTKVLKK